MPTADRDVLDPAEKQEDGNSEDRRHDHRGQKLFALQLGGVTAKKLADADIAEFNQRIDTWILEVAELYAANA